MGTNKMDTDKLIEEMTKDLKSVKPIGCCSSQCAIWGLISLSFVAIALFTLGGVRYNLDQALQSPQFLLDNALLLISGFCATLAAANLSKPDTKIRKRTYALLSVSTFIWVGISLYSVLTAPDETLNNALHNHSGWVHNCVISLTMMITLPTALLLYLTKKSAPVYLGWTGYALILATSSFGALGMRYLCSVDEHAHLFLWHFLPVALYACFGMILGRFLLRW